MPSKIRFFHFHSPNDGPVKITLHKGQKLHHYYGAPTDEGWFSESVSWEFDGRTIIRESVSDGRDCDGRLTRGSVQICRYVDVQSGPEFEGVSYPAWDDENNWQRDQSAEAMNY